MMSSFFRRILCCIAVLLAASAFRVSAQDLSSQRSRKERLEKEIAQIEQQLKDNSTKSANALNSLTLVRKQISNRKELLAESEAQLTSLNDTIARCQRRADLLQARLDTMTYYYGRLVRNAYKNRDARVWYMYLLASKNIAQATRRYGYLRSLSGTMNDKAAEIKETGKELADEISRLEGLRAAAQSLRDSRRKDLEKLKTEEARSDKLVSQLKKDKTRYQQQLSSRRKQVEALNKEIEKLIAQAMKASKSASKGSGKAPVDYVLSGEFKSNKGKLPWPADGPVVEKFGRHNHPVYTNLVMPFNNGVNISLQKGSEVKAVFDGVVQGIIVQTGYNKCVLVQHGGYFTFYCKLGDVRVKKGDKVKTGQVLGTVDTIDGQNQLHFEVWEETTPQNPETWLRPQ